MVHLQKHSDYLWPWRPPQGNTSVEWSWGCWVIPFQSGSSVPRRGKLTSHDFRNGLTELRIQSSCWLAPASGARMRVSPGRYSTSRSWVQAAEGIQSIVDRTIRSQPHSPKPEPAWTSMELGPPPHRSPTAGLQDQWGQIQAQSASLVCQWQQRHVLGGHMFLFSSFPFFFDCSCFHMIVNIFSSLFCCCLFHFVLFLCLSLISFIPCCHLQQFPKAGSIFLCPSSFLLIFVSFSISLFYPYPFLNFGPEDKTTILMEW